MLGEVVKGVLLGAVSGAIIAFTGYLKSSTVEKFNWKKARQTIIVGAVIGGIGGYFGWTYERAEEWASNMGILVLVEQIKKAIIRRLPKK
ncbi:MAG: hypothetical protein DRP01_02200 [Archaeoglobales archaeon]|nr:MAG: hypothetical protein DRP01_02200 [Archaeoglobales archaeon]